MLKDGEKRKLYESCSLRFSYSMIEGSSYTEGATIVVAAQRSHCDREGVSDGTSRLLGLICWCNAGEWLIVDGVHAPTPRLPLS